MASKQEEPLAFSAAYEDDTPTPSGWKRKLIPRIGKGLIPLRTDVIFITPGGEEFASKAQLQRYLKANKGSPSISEFIWIVDEFPQRLTRSKSMPSAELQKVELPLKLASKRKPAKGVPAKEIETTNKRRRVPEKSNEHEELPVTKGKHTRPVVSTDTPSERESESKPIINSPPVSPKRKRSVKNTKKATVSAATGAKTVDTNGEADLGKKDEPVDDEPADLGKKDEPVDDESAGKLKKSSKKSTSKARTARGGRRKGAKKVVADDTKEAVGKNAVDDMKETAADSGGDDSRGAERVAADITAQDGMTEAAASDEENLVAESTA